MENEPSRQEEIELSSKNMSSKNFKDTLVNKNI